MLRHIDMYHYVVAKRYIEEVLPETKKLLRIVNEA
jgi:hypothetical protein